ncbi:MAG TPA: peptidase M20, partial [Acidobacteriaceae bacterium]
MSIVRASLAGLTAAGLSLLAGAQTLVPTPAKDREEAIAIFKQLIEINTTDTEKGSVTAGNAAMEKRFLDAGFPREDVQMLGPDKNKMNLIVRYRAAG